jgi:surface antigen
MLHKAFGGWIVAAVSVGLVVMNVAYADPPDWAPAHGRRAHEERQERHEHRYRGYDGRYYEHDYGIVDRGRCNTDEILAVTGAVAGGVIGNRSSSPDNSAIATVVGAVIGAVVGNAIGDSIDDRDRACMGHALALAPIGRSVRWTNSGSHVAYTLIPQHNLRDGCREFQLRIMRERRARSELVRACRNERGEWMMRQ